MKQLQIYFNQSYDYLNIMKTPRYLKALGMRSHKQRSQKRIVFSAMVNLLSYQR